MLDKFDPNRSAVINPNLNGVRSVVECCIINFISSVESLLLTMKDVKIVDELRSVTGNRIIYMIEFKGIRCVFYTSTVGAPASVGFFESARELLDTNFYISFGICGYLKSSISANTIIVPTESYRDEGTSYHYLEDSDYIKHDKSPVVQKFFQRNDIPYVSGRNWTTDAIFRETRSNISKHLSEGCISVDMELSALQAAADYRGTSLYSFLVSGDLVDIKKYNRRLKDRKNIDRLLLDYVLNLAYYIRGLIYMFRVVDKKDSKYLLQDLENYSFEYVDKKTILRAVKLGIEIQGVALVNGKLVVQKYNLKRTVLKHFLAGEALYKDLDGSEYIYDTYNDIVLTKLPINKCLYYIDDCVARVDDNVFWDCFYDVVIDSVKVIGGRGLKSASFMFSGCSNLVSIDLTDFDFSNVTATNKMFFNCSMLEDIKFSSDINTSRLVSMVSMFDFCSSLVSVDLSKFNTENVTNMANMFKDCSYVEKLDLRSFSTKSCTDLSCMFCDCNSLIDIKFGDKFSCSNVEVFNKMFISCSSLKSLTLPLKSRKGVDFSYMFYNCKSLESLDLGEFTMDEDINNYSDMFGWCQNLKKLNSSLELSDDKLKYVGLA